MFLITFRYKFLYLVAIHYLISLIHISILQQIRFNSMFSFMDVTLLIINVIIHLFMPFNMSEGSTYLQYCVAYSIEFIENLVKFLNVIPKKII